VPRDIFGRGKGAPPPSDDIEREAQKELDRLTARQSPAGPYGNFGGMGGAPGPSIGAGPPSPLEEMAMQVQDRKQASGRRRRRSAPEQQGQRKGFTGFQGAAAMTGSVGSALSFGGGVGPGGRKQPPPADAVRLGEYPPERQVAPAPHGRAPNDDDDDADDDIGVTEMALRDHAERFGRGLEDTMIRSDPAAAESMREQALRKFMERQAAQRAGGGGQPPGSALRMRTTKPALGGVLGRMRAVPDPDDEPEEGEPVVDEAVAPDAVAPDAVAPDAVAPDAVAPDAVADVPDEEDEIIEEPDDDHELDFLDAEDKEAPGDEPMAVAGQAGGPRSGDDRRAQLAEERALMAEERARLAEDRARLGEERSSYAEARAWAAEQASMETAGRVTELEAALAQAEQATRDARKAEPAPAPAPAPAERATGSKPRAVKKAKKADAPAESAVKAAEPVTKGAAKATKAAAKKAAPSAKAAAKKAASPAAKAAPAKAASDDTANRAPRAKKTMKRSAPATQKEAPPAATSDDGARLGGVLGRRLAAKKP